jgi:hypothetical protein
MKTENFVLVPAGFRQRQGWLNPNPRTWEEIQAAEKEAAERKRIADAKRASEVAAEEEAFTKKKDAAEQKRQKRKAA